MLDNFKSLEEKLRSHIDQKGPITTESYMKLCLTDPDFGYYSKNDPIGKGGDFITSPEISQIFGELIGLWCAEIWSIMGKPEQLHLVELGPGRGTLISDALRALQIVPELIKQVKIHLVENNQTLTNLQKKKLQNHSSSITWHKTLETLPLGHSIFIANEFFDAMPVKQFEYKDRKWFERHVTTKTNSEDTSDPNFKFCLMDTDIDLKKIFSQLGIHEQEIPENDEKIIFEYRQNCLDIITQIAKHSKDFSKSLLIIDYGHKESTFGDTLQSVKMHKYVDPLLEPGKSDLTTQVDFNQIRYAVEKNHMKCYGPMPQGQFLLSLGLSQRLNQLLKNVKNSQYEHVKSGAQRLVNPDQMGILFKVLVAMSSNLPKPPPY